MSKNQETDGKIEQLKKIFPDKMSWDYLGSFPETNWIKRKESGFNFDDPDVFSKMLQEEPEETEKLIRIFGDTDEVTAEARKPATKRKSRARTASTADVASKA